MKHLPAPTQLASMPRLAAHVVRRSAVIVLLALCAACSTAGADAQCPAAEALMREHGISFSGFEKTLPRTGDPQAMLKGEEAIRIRLRNKKGPVADGFEHTAVISRRQQRAWILRTGGFAGVHEWYGPVPVQEFDASGCQEAAPSPP